RGPNGRAAAPGKRIRPALWVGDGARHRRGGDRGGLHHPEKPGGAPSADQGAGRACDPDRAAPGRERDRLGQCREISRGGGSSGNRTFTRAPGSGTGIRRYDEKLIIVIVRAEPAHPHPLAQVALATSPASGRGNSSPRPADPAGRGKAEG